MANYAHPTQYPVTKSERVRIASLLDISNSSVSWLMIPEATKWRWEVFSKKWKYLCTRWTSKCPVLLLSTTRVVREPFRDTDALRTNRPLARVKYHLLTFDQFYITNSEEIQKHRPQIERTYVGIGGVIGVKLNKEWIAGALFKRLWTP